MGGIVLSSNFRSHTRISGNNNGLQKHGVISATGKDSELKKSLQVVISEEQSFTKGNVTIARKADSNYCSRFTGPMHYRVIQKEHITALIDKHSYDVEVTLLEETKEELLWWYSNLHPWKITDSSASRFSHFFGCVPRRLGGIMFREQIKNRGTLVISRETEPHKLSRVESGSSSNYDFHVQQRDQINSCPDG